MSRTPFLILNFLDFIIYVVMTPIFPANQRRCASSSKNVAILSLWSKRAIIAPNNLIDSHHYKRHKKIRMTCLFIVNTSKISELKRSVKITDCFTCTSANVIYCITCTLCNKLYIGETGRRLGDRFRKHLRDVEKNDKDASEPGARHLKKTHGYLRPFPTSTCRYDGKLQESRTKIHHPNRHP